MTKETEPYWIENWYEIHDLPNNVVAIGEPRHQEEVFCYLVKGKDKDLLIDTGMGVKPIINVLERERNSDKPLVVVNTHWHFDHIGGNIHFDKILVPKNKREVAGLFRGWSPEELAEYFFVGGFIGKDKKDNTPPMFDAKNFSIPPAKNIDPVLIHGYQINLGDRVLRAITTPGHTPGSICLFDEASGLLFTGDLLYEGPLYAFEKESDPIKYLASLRKIARLSIQHIHPGHNYPENDYEPELIIEAIHLFEMARAKKEPDEDKVEGFPEAVAYVKPGVSQKPLNGKRRLKVLVNENYITIPSASRSL